MGNGNRFTRHLIALFSVAAMVAGTAVSSALAETSFKEDVFPVIQIRCLSCHQPGGEGFETSGLDLRSYEGLMKGTKFGAIVVPGSALESNLNVMIEGRAVIRMPHNKKPLSNCERLIFRSWVLQGARNN